MELYHLKDGIRVCCVTASSFPQGIQAAFEKLHSILPSLEGRILYGLSRPENGTIVYKAAATETYEGEAVQYGCEPYVIPKGSYHTVLIKDFMKNVAAIGETFQQLIADPKIDPQGYCVEVYNNDKDVLCMVRLDPAQAGE